jgi:mannitol-1-phosphate/altronate dehydrogenase
LLSCDNLQSNGAVARRAMLAFAALREEALRDWIAAHVTFPNCMVDRITPQTTAADRAMVARTFGIADVWPVICEPFRQWIVEDTFCAGRPPLEEAGVQFTADVHPYEMMKIRLLNASHSAMGYLGYLAGYRYIHDVMRDPLFDRYIERLMEGEVSPLLPPVPGIDLAAYRQTLRQRFANPKIADQVARICLDGSAKVPGFVLPSVGEALAAGRPYRLLALAVAGWMRYLRGTDEQGQAIDIEDARAAELQTLARQGGDDPRPLLGLRDLFGDLGQHEGFVAQLSGVLRSLSARGARATLDEYLATQGT